MLCAAILMAQHTHVWAAVSRVGLILRCSWWAETLSEVVLFVFCVIRDHGIVLVACPRHVYRLWQQ